MDLSDHVLGTDHTVPWPMIEFHHHFVPFSDRKLGPITEYRTHCRSQSLPDNALFYYGFRSQILRLDIVTLV